jgi:hypothetical protein
VQGEGLRNASGGELAHRPHVVGGDGRHSIQPVEAAGVGMIDDVQSGAVPVHDQRVPRALKAAHHPNVVRRHRLHAEELRLGDGRRGNEAPAPAVPMLD